MSRFFPNDHFDVICCEYVIEHVGKPRAAFLEFVRVLKPGGRLVVQTPNVLSYKSLAAWLLPQPVHLALGVRRYGVAEPEMYPTLYRCNTGQALIRAMAAVGLTADRALSSKQRRHLDARSAGHRADAEGLASGT